MKFKVGESLLICSDPAGTHFHGKVGIVKTIKIYGDNQEYYHVTIDGDEGANNDGTRGWKEGAFRKLTKLDKALK